MAKVIVNPSFKKKLEAAIAEKTAHLAAKIYNSIVMNEETFPYWSGAYVNSWKVNQSGQGGNIPQGKPDQYSIPNFTYAEPNYSAPYKSWFVANAYDYAHNIEYKGTKTSSFVPWMTIHTAVNSIKYF